MSILAQLSGAQRAEIKQQLRGGPKRLSEITVTGLDPLNPWHRELKHRYVASLADAGRARLVYGQNTDAVGRPTKAEMLGWQWVE